MSAKKFKKGDRVRVKDFYWYSQNQKSGVICFPTSQVDFTKYMSSYCGKILTIESVTTPDLGERYYVKENPFAWIDEMLDGEEDDIEVDGILKLIDIGDGLKKIIVNKDFELMIDPEGDSFVIPKLKFPKTYIECCNVLGKVARTTNRDDLSYNPELIYSLQKLLICRDAYWKLLEDWKPTKNQIVYGIVRNFGQIETLDDRFGECELLEFPTREIRDLFFKNFKELIESALL